MVGPAGLEPVTPTMSTWYSNQLSYGPIYFHIISLIIFLFNTIIYLQFRNILKQNKARYLFDTGLIPFQLFAFFFCTAAFFFLLELDFLYYLGNHADKLFKV